MPAFVKRSVGSSPGTSGELGTMRWPRDSKNLRNEDRISLEVIFTWGSAPHPGSVACGAPRPAPLPRWRAVRAVSVNDSSQVRSVRLEAADTSFQAAGPQEGHDAIRFES